VAVSSTPSWFGSEGNNSSNVGSLESRMEPRAFSYMDSEVSSSANGILKAPVENGSMFDLFPAACTPHEQLTTESDVRAVEERNAGDTTQWIELQFGDALICVWSDRVLYETIFENRNITHWDRCEIWQDPQPRNASESLNCSLCLNDCLDEFSCVDNLDGDQAWDCPRCQTLTPAQVRLQLWRVPEILTIQLKRLNPEQGTKVHAFINFPVNKLDLTDRVGDKTWIMEVRGERHLYYDLFAVANHVGGLHGGHYTADVQNFVDGEWYHFDGSFLEENHSTNKFR